MARHRRRPIAVKRQQQRVQTPAQHRPQPSVLPGRKTVPLLGQVILGIAALVSAAAAGGYGVERWHDTQATIDAGGDIDQKKPFSYPWRFSNPSTIFTMYGVKAFCLISAEYSDPPQYKASTSGGQQAMSGTTTIQPKGAANFVCNTPDQFSLSEGETPGGKPIPLTAATITMNVQYETRILLWTIPQTITETFTLLNTTTGYRWVKGIWMNR